MQYGYSSISSLRWTPLCICAVLTLANICNAGSHLSQEKPNIVLIFADDLGYGSVGAFFDDCPFDTPRLDRMASEGAMLTSFYVPTPYCAPSRGTILTGRYPFRHTLVNNPAPDAGQSIFGLPSAEITIAELLKEQGYKTAMFGKWHLGHREQWLPRTQGFDEYYGILYSNDMYPVQMVENEKVVEYPVPQAKLTKTYTDRTIDFIETHKHDPFFVYLPMAMPHKPLAVSDDFYTPETPDDLYHDVMSELDFSVGRILDKLDELNLGEKTLVVFTSDNGASYGGSSGNLRGMKGRTWEGGLRVPMIARMPGTIPAGLVTDEPTATVDMLPTISALTGARVPTDRIIDGHNILPLLQDAKAKSPHEAIFGMRGDQIACVRSGKWKLHVLSPGPINQYVLTPEEIATWKDPRGPDGITILAPFQQPRPYQYPGILTGDEPTTMMLFDMENDSAEQFNVAGEHPEIVERLKTLYDQANDQIPEFPQAESAYLFREPARGERRVLMRLIGGELRYDKIPTSQKHLLKP